MARFEDRLSRSWDISLDPFVIRDVRSATGVDLADVEGRSQLKLIDDPCLLVDVLWLLVREQAEKRDVSDRQFGRALGGDAIEAAACALIEAVCDFFPKKKRQLVEAIYQRTTEVHDRAIQKMLERIKDPKVIREMEDAVDAAIRTETENLRTQWKSVSSSPASSESSPAD